MTWNINRVSIKNYTRSDRGLASGPKLAGCQNQQRIIGGSSL